MTESLQICSFLDHETVNKGQSNHGFGHGHHPRCQAGIVAAFDLDLDFLALFIKSLLQLSDG